MLNKPSHKVRTLQELTERAAKTTREHLLNEAANRAEWYFKRTDLSYEFPTSNGQVIELIEMLIMAKLLESMPTSK